MGYIIRRTEPFQDLRIKLCVANDLTILPPSPKQRFGKDGFSGQRVPKALRIEQSTCIGWDLNACSDLKRQVSPMHLEKRGFAITSLKTGAAS